MSDFKVLKKKTYLSAINNSIGSQMFRDLWAEYDDGEVKNLTKGGELSCALYVSWVLKIFDLIDQRRATVDGVMKNLIELGWEEVDKADIQEGDVIEWERKTEGFTHGHVGFYAGDNKAISNSWKLKKIVKHGWDFGGRRDIVKVLRWSQWDE